SLVTTKPRGSTMTPEPSEVRPLAGSSSVPSGPQDPKGPRGSTPRKPNGLCCGRSSLTTDTTAGAVCLTASTTGVRRDCWAGVGGRLAGLCRVRGDEGPPLSDPGRVWVPGPAGTTCARPESGARTKVDSGTGAATGVATAGTSCAEEGRGGRWRQPPKGRSAS